MTETLGTFAQWVGGAVALALIAVVTLALVGPFLAGLFGWPWLGVEWISRRVRASLHPMRLRTVFPLLLAIFAWFVWPTPYRDLPCSTGAASLGDCNHINRITGAICRVSQTCWINPRMW
jgi:hypothetical protein